jgi:hypothetical protein
MVHVPMSERVRGDRKAAYVLENLIGELADAGVDDHPVHHIDPEPIGGRTAGKIQFKRVKVVGNLSHQVFASGGHEGLGKCRSDSVGEQGHNCCPSFGPNTNSVATFLSVSSPIGR